MSVSLTISNLDEETFRRLQAEAKRSGSDPETVARKLLTDNLQTPSDAAPPRRKRRDLSALAGSWTEEEYQEFMDAIADFGRIEPEMWQ
jgi:plasmid stability protein